MPEGDNPRWITAAEVAENYQPKNGGGGIGGSIADQQVAFGNGTDIAGSDGLKWYDNQGALLFSHNGPPASTGDLRFRDHFQVYGYNQDIDDDVSVLSFANGKTIVLGDIQKVAAYISLSDPFQDGEIDINAAADVGDVNIQAPSGNAYLTAGNGDCYLSALNGVVEILNVMKLTPTADPDPLEEGMVWAGLDHKVHFYDGTSVKTLAFEP